MTYDRAIEKRDYTKIDKLNTLTKRKHSGTMYGSLQRMLQAAMLLADGNV